MRISYQWLREYVKLPDSLEPETVAEKLKLSTVEVEEIIKANEFLENVVVGKVIKAEKHPGADKLKVCTVDIGDEKVTIVCGGSNVEDGMLCAVAKIGAKVKWHGAGEPVVMEKASIRGVESSGMICGADEIGLLDLFPKKSEKEIVDLTVLKLKVGKPIAEALKLDNTIFEIDNKSLSNRPDLWGHYGLAREVAALTNRSVLPLDIKPFKPGTKSISLKVENSKDCLRYMAVAVAGVKIEESPLAIKQRLIAAGLRPINNVVDITNYVMLALGQPMHAFDARLLTTEKGLNIGVRASKEGENFTTLDGKERILPVGSLLITSSDRPVAIAGIMGGMDSEVKNDTETVVFEAANFSGSLIRKISNELGLRTDASARFEKKLDPALCETALNLAVQMLLGVCHDAKIASKIADSGESKKRTRPLEMPADFVEKFSGVKIPQKTQIAILERLGFKSVVNGNFLEVTVPSWRAEDVVSPEAVVEEVLRIHGYQNVVGSLPNFVINPPLRNILRSVERLFGEISVRDFGYNEVYNYSFVSSDQIKKLGDDPSNALELDNPLSQEKPYLRRSLLPNLVEIFNKNSERSSIKIFEIGQVYQKDLPGFRATAGGSELLPRQDTIFTALYFEKENENPYFEAKRLGIKLLSNFDLSSGFQTASPAVEAHPARAEEIKIQESIVAKCFELHPKIAKSFGIEGRVGVLEINLTALLQNSQLARKINYHPLPLYPEVKRDIAFLVNKDVANASIVAVIKSSGSLLKEAVLFDSFVGGKLPSDKKSLAYHLVFSNPERTLTSEEVADAENKIKDAIVKEFKAEFR